MIDRRVNRIKLEDCQHRKLYKLIARNIVIGVFNKEDQAFYGIRTKFNARYIDSENHWDAPAYATCCPMAVIGELPENIEIDNRIDLFAWLEQQEALSPWTHKEMGVAMLAELQEEIDAKK